MGNGFTKLFHGIVPHGQDWNVVMIGLDNVGKTTLIQKLKYGKSEEVYTTPTIGFNVEVVTPCKGLTFTMWDIGGQDKLRRLWSNYYTACRAIIFIVDSSDRQRLPESRKALHLALEDPAMPKDIPVMILANKQDLPSALSAEDIFVNMGLEHVETHECMALGTVITRSEGTMEAMKTLKKMLKRASKK